MRQTAVPLPADNLTEAVRTLLQGWGEDPGRPGLVDTPARVVEAFGQLTEGYRMDAWDVVADAVFEQAYDEMVMVRDIQFYSLCEHHLLPFFGVAHVAYLPKGKVVGLSKLPRLVDAFAHRLQVQERLTREIAEAIQEVVEPRGVAVVMEARHLCMEMRGVRKESTETVTSCMLGGFRQDPRTRAEFLDLIRRRSA